jgi:hypothetical protein
MSMNPTPIKGGTQPPVVAVVIKQQTYVFFKMFYEDSYEGDTSACAIWRD